MTNNTPLVSVVVPSYNRPNALIDSLSSIKEQTYQNIEVIVVDDASEIPVEEVLDDAKISLSYPITIIRHDVNKGASAARNAGIKQSEGKFIAFLDDDDLWYPRKIEAQVDRFRSTDDDIGVVYTGMEFVNAEGEPIRSHVETVEGDVTKELLRRNFIGSFSTIMVRSKVIDNTGVLDQRFPCWQDIEWYIRISKNWEFACVREILVRMRQQEGEHISDDFEQIRDTAFSLFVEKYRSLARTYGKIFEREFLGWVEFRVGAYNALRTGHYSAARRHLFRAVKQYPLELRFWLYLVVAIGGEPAYKLGKRLTRS